MTIHQPDDKLIAKIRALLETRGCTEAEASSRIAKAQELLEKHGLEMANLSDATSGKRSDTVLVGGLYTWQRRLWDGVAKLNFCTYFFIRGLSKGSKYEHRLIGSHANVVSTEIMASYLQGVIEEHAQAWAKDYGYQSVFVREAIAYREGMTSRVVDRLAARRQKIVSEARVEAERTKAATHQANHSEINRGSGQLTILDVISSEEDFNNDYLNHWEMGTTARNRAESEARGKAWRAKWDAETAARDADEAAHPWKRDARLKAAAERMAAWEKEEARKEAKRNRTPPKERYRRATPEEERAGLQSFYEGHRKGDEVGIDTQVAKGRDAARLS